MSASPGRYAAVVAPQDLGNCSTVVDDSSMDVYCGGSRPTMFQAEVLCGDHTVRLGDWEYAGGAYHSYAHCNRNVFIVGKTINFYAL